MGEARTRPNTEGNRQNPQQPRDINEQMEQMFRQAYGMSWEEMMGGKPNTADTAKKDEEKRQNEAAEQARIKRDADQLARELGEIRRAREEETRQKDEFDARVSQAWQERLSRLTFRERMARTTNPNWDFREHNALRQKMELEDKIKDREEAMSKGQQKLMIQRMNSLNKSLMGQK